MLLCAVLVLLAGCGRTATPSAAPGPSAPPSQAAPQPSAVVSLSNSPSVSAAMVCADEAQHDIQAALGVAPPKPPASTWADHLFTCTYTYPFGVMVLSVKELPDEASTQAYLADMRKQHPGGGELPGLGQGAYEAPNGSMLVRKDFKVLWVDVTGLPDKFGPLAVSRADAGFRVATVIIGCWTGA